MDDLNQGNSGQSIFQIAMGALGEMIADLDRIGSAEALLLDDIGNSLSRRQEECSDRGRNGRGNFRDLLIADDARAAWHV